MVENENKLSIEDLQKYFDKKEEEGQTHNHEFLGSTQLAENDDEEVEEHNHRFAGLTSQVIPKGKSHIHAILTTTDFYENHLHEVGVLTGLAIDVGNGKHVHFAEGTTTENAGHTHDFMFATLIEDPISQEDNNHKHEYIE
jgi:hypothetical protein